MTDKTNTTSKITMLFLVVVLIFVKFIYLDRTPLFADEAHYCYLGYQIQQQGWRGFWQQTIFVFKDAPLLLFLNGLALFIPGVSAIDACRGVVVLSFGIGAWLLWKLTRNPWALLFYGLNPFSFFASRTNLMEPLLMTIVLFYCWSVLNKRIFLAITALALMFAAKQAAILAVPIPFLWQLKKTRDLAWLLGVGLLLTLGLKLATPLWDTASIHATASVDLGRIKQNVWLMGSWLVQYLEWPGIILIALGGSFGLWGRRLGLLLIFLLIVGVYALAGYTLFPRYLLVLVPFMAILVGEVAKFKWGKFVITLTLLLFIHKDWVIITAPERAVIAKEDHYQYWDDWSSGSGSKAALVYLASQADLLPEETVFVPADIQGIWVISQITYFPHLNVHTKFYSQSSEIGDKGLLINTSSRAFKRGRLLFASNGEAKNSVRVERLGQ